MPEQTTVKVTADLSQMKEEFAAGTAEFKRWSQNINAGNATAMKAFRDTAEELRQLGKDARVSNEEMDKLNRTIGTVENASTRAGMRSATAFEQGARGLSVMARQGTVTARSMNQIIAAGSDIAFAFGPEGAVLSAVLMVTAGIVSHFESTASKMDDVARQFNEHVTDMLMNDSPIEAARAAGRAYVEELQAIANLKADSARTAGKGAFDTVTFGDIIASARVAFGSDDDAVMAGANKTDAARAAERTLAPLHAHDKEIDQLKGDEKQARTELTSWQEKVAQLRGEGKTSELAVAVAERNRLQDSVNGLRQQVHGLEQDRINTAARLAQDKSLTDAQRYALTHPDKPRELSDFSDEDHRSDAAVSSHAADQRIQQMQRSAAQAKQVRAAQLRDETRATSLLIQMQDAAAQHEALADGQREAADKARAERDYHRRLDEIDSLHLTEGRKTALLVAAAQERDAAIAAVERTAYDRQQNALLKHMMDMLKVNDAAVKAQERAEQKKQEVLTSILASSGDALVRGHGDLAHRIMQAALEPEVKYLQGMAMKHYALAAKDAAVQNWVGAAEQIAGATALMAGASLVASFAGGGGGGGGGGSAGGGGGGNNSGANFAASGTAHQTTHTLEVIVVHQDATGREIQRTRQQIQRLDDRNVSTRVGGLG